MIYELLLMFYVVGTIAGLWFVFGKAGEAPWKALVPLYNIWVWLKICNKGWKWIVGFLVPGINIFVFLLLVVETARVFRRTSFWEQTFGVLLPCVYLPILGLTKMEYHNPKTDPPEKITEVRDWTESIVFALIAAVLIRGFVFELFSIPSSSMEKSLMVGDHLIVSKMAYGPRVIMTRLALPLMHNTVVGTKLNSYLEWPQLPYYRYPGYSHVKRYDAVVFNFPAGDTVLTNFLDGKYTYYEAIREMGREAVVNGTAYHPVYGPLGKIKVRPVDKRENYIKRCMGLPGETLQIIDKVVHIDGKPVELPTDAEFDYEVIVAAGFSPDIVLSECGVSKEDIETSPNGYDGAGNRIFRLPLTAEMAERMKAKSTVVGIEQVEYPIDSAQALYPNAPGYYWSVDNYGPVLIPAKGKALKLTQENLPLYSRVITAYEHNTLEVKDGKIYINGAATDSYTPKMDYYWMMGDNRHHSQDSRFWGFVPEDHIVGKAKRVLWSMNKDKFGVRLERTMRDANAR